MWMREAFFLHKSESLQNRYESVVWIEMGELIFMPGRSRRYMDAPLLGEDIGYAFPTGQNLFLKMPDLTSDIDKEWFKDHLRDIAELTNRIDIEKR